MNIDGKESYTPSTVLHSYSMHATTNYEWSSCGNDATVPGASPTLGLADGDYLDFRMGKLNRFTTIVRMTG